MATNQFDIEHIRDESEYDDDEDRMLERRAHIADTEEREWEDGVDCHRVGISGWCGLKCPVLIRGECDVQEEMLDDKEITAKDKILPPRRY